MQADPTERAWAAGFWDGEGYVGLDKRHATPLLAVTQCGWEAEILLRRFLIAIGQPQARIYERHDMRPGRDGTNIRRVGLVGAVTVQQALDLCSPWLSETKRRQAQAALDAHAQRKAQYVNYWSAKTHCKHGHPFDDRNTYLERRPNGRSARRCRACDRARYYRAKASRAETEDNE